MRIHKSLTTERVMRAAECQDGTGYCTACGAEASQCEPDAQHYPCRRCGERAVFGAEEILFLL